MSKYIIKDFKGLNSSLASLQLKPGEVPFSQNFRGRPYTNYARRKGVDPVSTQTGAVLGIFEIDLDGVVIPLIQSPNTLTFNPPIQSPNFPITGDMYSPVTPPLDSGGVTLLIFDLEQAMRAIQDRRVVAGHITWDWPNIRFDINGNRINQAVGNYPATGTYRGDISYDDFYNGNPIGTKAASLVNQILAACIDTVGLGDWIKTIEGLSSVLLYDSTIFPTASSATATNYRTVFANTKVGIRKLITIQKGAQQTVVESKTGTAQDSPAATCNPLDTANYKISGYVDGLFPLTGVVPCNSTSCTNGYPVFDGKFPFVTDCTWGYPFLQFKCVSGKDPIEADLIYDGGTSSYFLFLGPIWNGIKTTGTTAAGVYTRYSTTPGCATGPASVTVVAY